MTQEDKQLFRKAIKYVESNYPPDFPYFVKFVVDKFYELNNDTGRKTTTVQAKTVGFILQ
jgi:hypothetical protein